MEQATKMSDWSSWRVSLAKLDIGDFEGEDGKMYYVPTITVFLGDDIENKNVFAITTDYLYEDIKVAIFNVAKNISNMFDNISASVYHFDKEGNIIEEFNLNQEVDDMLIVNSNRTIH